MRCSQYALTSGHRAFEIHQLPWSIFYWSSRRHDWRVLHFASRMTVLEAFQALVPDVLLPAALNDTRTSPLLDAFPLLSMILALPALRLFWRTHRNADLVSYRVTCSSSSSQCH